MPTSTLDARPVLRGSQEPSFCSFPTPEVSSGLEVVELARAAGLDLDPWQRFVLVNSLGEVPGSGGLWLTPDVGLVVPRQNGKSALLAARELAGLFLFGERLIIHSAHEFATSLEQFHKVLSLIDDRPDFKRQVASISRSHGDEGITLKSGQRLRFKTRTKGGGRGFSCDCLVLDEAMELPDTAYAAMRPTVSARPNPQIWHVGSAVDQKTQVNGLVLARVRRAGYMRDARTAFFEWAADEHDDPADPATWAKSNPTFGIRIDPDTVAQERRLSSPDTFAVERLGIGDWPDPDGAEQWRVVSQQQWAELADPAAERGTDVVFGVDVGQDRIGTVAVAWNRSDGAVQVMVADEGVSPRQMGARLVELQRTWDGRVVLGGPAVDLADEVPGAVCASGAEFAAACGRFNDLAREGGLRHGNQRSLTDAVRLAQWRSAGTAGERAFQLKDAPTVGPLAAAVRALHGLRAAIDITESIW